MGIISIKDKVDADSQNKLGEQYWFGNGVEQNYDEALKWYRKAAVQGHSVAQAHLGVAYYEGEGVERDYTEAFKWISQAAKQAQGLAQFVLGEMYEKGRGVENDIHKAQYWYKKGSESGIDAARIAYNHVKDYEFAEEWYWKGDDEFESGNIEEGLKLFKKAARAGYADAAWELACKYKNGDGVYPNKSIASQWSLRAAELGDSTAQDEMGYICLRKKRYKEAFYWFSKAVQGGTDTTGLAWCYQYGLGVACDYTEAIRHYKPYESMFPDKKIEYRIGFCYEMGLNNITEARKWYQLSGQKNYDPALTALRQMEMVEKDRSGVESWFKKGEAAYWNITHHTYPDGSTFTGHQSHFNSIRHVEAMRWWHKAAVQGHAESQYHLAKYIYHKKLKSEAETNNWMTIAANNNNDKAAIYLAYKYYYGKGAADYEKSIKWFLIIAKRSGYINNALYDYLYNKIEIDPIPNDNLPQPSSPKNIIDRPSIRSTIFKILGFLLFTLIIVFIRRMDSLSYRPLSDEEVYEMAQEVNITVPNQEITLFDTDETQKLPPKSTVKILGICKNKLNRGDSPLLVDHPVYLLELPDSTRAYGRLMETAIGQTTLLSNGDTAVISGIKKLKKAPKTLATSEKSRSEYVYTLEGRDEQLAIEDLNPCPSQRVVYQFGRTDEKKLFPIRSTTKKNGFFLFPKRQGWNEFRLSQRQRTILLILAYLIEIVLIIRLFKNLSNWNTNRLINKGKQLLPGRLHFYKFLTLLVFAAIVVLIRRMDQMTYRPITEDEALEMAQDVKITVPNQEITLLDTLATQPLKVKSIVKVLGIYKEKLNKGNAPFSGDNLVYLMELPDGTWGYGPLAEASIVQRKMMPDGDTVVQCVTYQGGVKKGFFYDLRPVTKKNGFFVFPKYQEWNEFRWPRWLRIAMIALAYLIELILLYKLWFGLLDWISTLKAKRGDGKACDWIGYCYENGHGGVDFDFDKALWWYKKASATGYSCLRLGELYEGRFPKGEMDIDYFKAMKYYEKGTTCKNKKTRKRCQKELDRLKLLTDYSSGFGKKYILALLGNAEAQFLVGNYYLTGTDVNQNYKEAIKWYRKALDQGYIKAYGNLGSCYYEGNGVPKDHNEAIRYFKKGAEMGDPTSMVNLGLMYYNSGNGPLSKTEGIHWLKQAAKLGQEDAIETLKKLGISKY